MEAGDQEGIQRLIQYFLRCPFSQTRMIRLRPERATSGQVEVTDAGKVIDKTEHHAVGRFPEPGDEELLAGPSRNCQVFDPMESLAEVTQHIPDPGEHLIRYYGWYSNLPAPRLRQAGKTRGQRTQRPVPASAGAPIPARSPTAREARIRLQAIDRRLPAKAAIKKCVAWLLGAYSLQSPASSLFWSGIRPR